MSRSSLLICLLTGFWLAQMPLTTKAAPRAAATAPDTPAVAVVRQFLDARAAGQAARAHALLSAVSQEGLPLAQEPEMLKEVLDPATQLPAGVLTLAALFVDFHDTLHFKFRVLGASGDDPAVVLVRAYRVGTPLSSIQILKIVTLEDPLAVGARRIDGVKTATIFFPDGPFFVQRVTSQLNLKRIALGIIQYVQDHNNTLPDAAHWADEIMPYVKSEAIFHDPSAPDTQKWSYAYNSTLSHQPLSKLDAPADTVMLFESTTGTKNASDAGTSVPVPGRHGGTDYALADSHIKWLPDNTKLSYQLDGK